MGVHLLTALLLERGNQSTSAFCVRVATVNVECVVGRRRMSSEYHTFCRTRQLLKSRTSEVTRYFGTFVHNSQFSYSPRLAPRGARRSACSPCLPINRPRRPSALGKGTLTWWTTLHTSTGGNEVHKAYVSMCSELASSKHTSTITHPIRSFLRLPSEGKLGQYEPAARMKVYFAALPFIVSPASAAGRTSRCPHEGHEGPSLDGVRSGPLLTRGSCTRCRRCRSRRHRTSSCCCCHCRRPPTPPSIAGTRGRRSRRRTT
jgi:hypothetical protein